MSIRTLAGLACCTVLIGVITTGCSTQSANAVLTSEKSVADKTLPKGWKKVVATGDKLSIGCPPGWKGMDLTAADLDKMMDASQADANTRSAVKMATSNKALKLLIIHAPGKSGFSPNVNVLVFPVPGGTNLDEAEKENVNGLKGTALSTPISSRTSIDGTDAYVVKWQQTSPLGKLEVDTYLLVKNDSEYLVTCTDVLDSAQRKDFESIAKSFHIG